MMHRDVALATLLCCLGCSPDDDAAARLSDLGLFTGELSELNPAAGVLPYEVNAPLWSDNADKHRFVTVPAGATATFDPGEAWSFPEGARLIKNFGFLADYRDPSAGRRLVETRVLTRVGTTWQGDVYLWNDEQTEAFGIVGGTRTDVSYIDEAGVATTHEYVVPNTNQCQGCHATNDAMRLLGFITPQINGTVERAGEPVNQLDWLAHAGLFDLGSRDPADEASFEPPFGDGELDLRARAWLHANCSHCHRPGGNGGSTGLVLTAEETNPTKLGICKSPIAAANGTGGRNYDIVPGDPDDSIMPYRMAATDADRRMPELPSKLPSARGVALIEAWIAAMPPQDCTP